MPGRNAKRHAAATIAFTTAIAIALGAATSPDAEALGSRGRLLKMINNVRERHDLRELRIDRSLSRDAVRHTRRMVEANDVFDPANLDTFLADEPWETVGSAVSGCAGTVRGLHRAWMGHGAHREIMLDGRLRFVGIGVIKDRSRNICGRGSIWGTELFYG